MESSSPDATGGHNTPTIQYPSTMNQLLWEQLSDGKLIP